MKTNRHGLYLAVREHITSGKPITKLEAMIFYGVSSLPALIRELRKQGWLIKSRTIPFAAAVKRVNEHAVFQPPQNLPTRDIFLTEYWLSR